jgi:hypothetical protein
MNAHSTSYACPGRPDAVVFDGVGSDAAPLAKAIAIRATTNSSETTTWSRPCACGESGFVFVGEGAAALQGFAFEGGVERFGGGVVGRSDAYVAGVVAGRSHDRVQRCGTAMKCRHVVPLSSVHASNRIVVVALAHRARLRQCHQRRVRVLHCVERVLRRASNTIPGSSVNSCRPDRRGTVRMSSLSRSRTVHKGRPWRPYSNFGSSPRLTVRL